MWDCNHDPKMCSSKQTQPSCKKSEVNKTEGEHDFIVIGPNYIAFVEVKNPSKQTEAPVTHQKNAQQCQKCSIQSSIMKSQTQFEKAEKLLAGIAEKSKTASELSSVDIFQIVAFPNLSQEGLSSLFDLPNCNDCEGKTGQENFLIINKDILEDLNEFWDHEIKCKSPQKKNCGDNERIQCALLRLFAAGKKGDRRTVDESKLSLSECVREIDRKLRDSEITFRTEKRLANPNVLRTSELPLVEGINIFQDCLRLKYITTEQWNAYNDERKRLVIAGPSGSGKTLVLIARMIRLALSEPQSRIVFLVANEMKLIKFSDIFRRAGIKVDEVEHLYRQNKHASGNTQVEIIHRRPFFYIGRIISPNDYLFVDDLQNIVNFRASPSEILLFAMGVPVNGVGIDLGQSELTDIDGPFVEHFKSILNFLKNYNITWLRKTYRNTHNIVSHLMALSSVYQEDTECFRDILVPLSHGHFIHGPQLLIQFHLKAKDDAESVERFLEGYLFPEIFTGTQDEQNSTACILYKNEFIGEGICKNYAEKYPSAVFSVASNGKLFEISSTEFTECHIVLPYTNYRIKSPEFPQLALLLAKLERSKMELEKASSVLQEPFFTRVKDCLEFLENRISLREKMESWTSASVRISNEMKTWTHDMDKCTKKIEQEILTPLEIFTPMKQPKSLFSSSSHELHLTTEENNTKKQISQKTADEPMSNSPEKNYMNNSVERIQRDSNFYELKSKLLESCKLMDEIRESINCMRNYLMNSEFDFPLDSPTRYSGYSDGSRLEDRMKKLSFFLKKLRLQIYQLGRFDKNMESILDEIVKMAYKGLLIILDQLRIWSSIPSFSKIEFCYDFYAHIRNKLTHTIAELKCLKDEATSFYNFDAETNEPYPNELNVLYNNLANIVRYLDRCECETLSEQDKSLPQFLYNAVSRTRVLCRIHVLVRSRSEQVASEEELRNLFPEARIRIKDGFDQPKNSITENE